MESHTSTKKDKIVVSNKSIVSVVLVLIQEADGPLHPLKKDEKKERKG